MPGKDAKRGCSRGSDIIQVEYLVSAAHQYARRGHGDDATQVREMFERPRDRPARVLGAPSRPWCQMHAVYAVYAVYGVT